MLTVRNPETFKWEDIPLKDCVEGNAKDTYYTLKLFEKFYDILEEEKRLVLMEDVMIPATEILAEVEFNGLNVDVSTLNSTGIEINKRLEELDLEIEKNSESPNITAEVRESRYPLNTKSTKDMADLLFLEEWGFGLYPLKFSEKTSNPSTDKESLSLILDCIKEELGSRDNGK